MAVLLSFLSSRACAFFTVGSGEPCELYNGGACVRSANFPQAYGTGESCTIGVASPVEITVNAFETENCCDKLTVNGVQYSGYSGPPDGTILDGGNIIWYTDFSVTKPGFKICMEDPLAGFDASAVVQETINSWSNSWSSPKKILVNTHESGF